MKLKQGLTEAWRFLHRILALCPRIYDARQAMQWRRMASFVARALLHSRRIRALLRFFDSQPLLCEIARAQPGVVEQAVRSFFYAGSSTAERARLIEQHFIFLLAHTAPLLLRKIYLEPNGLLLWQEEDLTLRLSFHRGASKEGLMSAALQNAGRAVYQVTFWFAPLPAGDETALWIGALQGAPESLNINRDLTKKFHGYRPQNLILRAARLVAQSFGATRVLAISDEGFYANNHWRLDRKLKTSMNKLWSECGGEASADARFFALPLSEPRKSEEEIPANKRALYRRRFAWLEAFDAALRQALGAAA